MDTCLQVNESATEPKISSIPKEMLGVCSSRSIGRIGNDQNSLLKWDRQHCKACAGVYVILRAHSFRLKHDKVGCFDSTRLYMGWRSVGIKPKFRGWGLQLVGCQSTAMCILMLLPDIALFFYSTEPILDRQDATSMRQADPWRLLITRVKDP